MNVHVRYNGLSYDLTGNELDVGVISTDNEIRAAVARYLDTPATKLDNFMLERVGEDVTLRPQAVFGIF